MIGPPTNRPEGEGFPPPATAARPRPPRPHRVLGNEIKNSKILQFDPPAYRLARVAVRAIGHVWSRGRRRTDRDISAPSTGLEIAGSPGQARPRHHGFCST